MKRLDVRGKLVPQDPHDEPVSELLNRIAKEKARLVKAEEIKKEKPLSPITEETQLFEVPKGWTWVRLDALSRLITKGSSPKWQGSTM
jgi:type I restriction enzyme S subunit